MTAGAEGQRGVSEIINETAPSRSRDFSVKPSADVDTRVVYAATTSINLAKLYKSKTTCYRPWQSPRRLSEI
jgi:hypothetical protein